MFMEQQALIEVTSFGKRENASNVVVYITWTVVVLRILLGLLHEQLFCFVGRVVELATS